MANFSSLLPKTCLRSAVLGAERTLTAPLVHLAASCKAVLVGEKYARHEIPGEWELCRFLHANRIRKGTAICNVKELADLLHHCFGVERSTYLGVFRVQTMNYGSMSVARLSNKSAPKSVEKQAITDNSESNGEAERKHQIGENVSKKDKIKFLVNTLLDMKDNKEVVYGALDAWVAWERNFPIASLKRVIAILEKEHQWHRIIQVIKWMLSKGQGNTMGTYGQLIRALDMDHRADEAHNIWVKKIGRDLHSVPWQLCRQMIAIYYRNKMLEELVKLFKGLEAFDRKPPEKSIVQKVADAYEMLGLLQEKERVLEKYKELFTETGSVKKSREASSKEKKKQGQEKHESTVGDHQTVKDRLQECES